MTPGEAIRTAVDNLAVHKLRSALTMLGMIFGVGAVIAMLSICAGAERQALSLVERLGLRNVLVRAKPFKDDELKEIRAKSPGVSPRDATAIAEAVPGVELASPSLKIEPYRVLSEAGKTAATAYGVSFRHATLAHLTLAEGRFLDRLDERTHAQVAVIGAGVRRDLFGYGPALGRDLKVDDVWLTVVGVLAPEGGAGDTFQGVNVGSVANAIYLPVSTAERKFEHPPWPRRSTRSSSACRTASRPGRWRRRSASSWTACMAAPPTTTWWCPRRSSSRAGAPSVCSTPSWGRSPASRSWSAASAS